MSRPAHPLAALAALTRSAMASGRQPPAEIDKAVARRTWLVHQLIHVADLRNVYREMREALISANRRAGTQQGLVTK